MPVRPPNGPVANDAIRTESALGLVPPPKQKALYSALHGSRGEMGVRPGHATAWPELPQGDSQRGFALVDQMYPNPPPVVTIPNGQPAHNIGPTAYLSPNSSPSTTAHEFEHTRQARPITKSPELQQALADEIGPTTLSNLLPQATHQSWKTAPTGQREDLKAEFPGGYQPSMTWMHNQAQQHGVFGATPLAKSLGFAGKGPQSITTHIANNPQWLGLIADHPLTAKPQKPAPYKSPLGLAGQPDLRGYLP